MKRLVERSRKSDNQCVDIRFFEGYPRSAYVGALFRAIKDIERGAIRDIEAEE